jgi:hypothetical protein
LCATWKATHITCSGVAWSLDGRTWPRRCRQSRENLGHLDGSRRKNIEGYEKEVTAIHFTGASDELITASGDNRVRLHQFRRERHPHFPKCRRLHAGCGGHGRWQDHRRRRTGWRPARLERGGGKVLASFGVPNKSN